MISFLPALNQMSYRRRVGVKNPESFSAAGNLARGDRMPCGGGKAEDSRPVRGHAAGRGAP